MKAIKIGDEFIALNKGDAHGGHILTITEIIKIDKKEADNNEYGISWQNLVYKDGQAKIKIETGIVRKWWLRCYCSKIVVR
jgi:hypothetical protein